MSKTEIEIILASLRSGNFHIVPHAVVRMLERRILEADIEEVGRTAFKTTRQATGRYKITGFDLSGDELVVVCVYEGSTVIITVF
jgi:hypothetical protein